MINKSKALHGKAKGPHITVPDPRTANPLMGAGRGMQFGGQIGGPSKATYRHGGGWPGGIKVPKHPMKQGGIKQGRGGRAKTSR